MSDDGERHLGLFSATAIGVGAIVGGGILALAGVAFAATGPGAMLAFGLNGVIAFFTAASFAELAARFPQSGGTYTYAKRVLSIEVAFIVGWVVWFASILAGVLYALGFAAFLCEGLSRIIELNGGRADALAGRGVRSAIALTSVAFYALALIRRARGGGLGPTVGKIVVFVILLAGGIWAWLGADAPQMLGRLDPFLPAGPLGLVQAMGYTFIALQGFDLIAAVGGEVRDPERNLPRSMYLSLGIALAIYIPLLFFIATVGAPVDGTIQQAGVANPEGLVAEAAGRFIGPVGYWLVIGAGVLSMLSALHANVLGASRVAFTMARDRTLPRIVGRMRGGSGTPAIAVMITTAMLAVVLIAVGDVTSAGAASSLIFLITFAMVHWAAILARRRSGDQRIPFIPLAGAALCLTLAVFQAFAVPEAGTIVVGWLVVGVALYLILLAPSASLADASAEARDPDLARLRGRSPLVLVPIANPASAASLVGVAATVRTPGAGRILLLSVIQTPDDVPGSDHPSLLDAQTILAESLQRGFERSAGAQTLFTVAPDVWEEIERVARLHGCETVMLGSPKLAEPGVEARIEELISQLDADVVIVRAPHRWRAAQVRRVLVPVGGRPVHSHLRARLLASLTRSGECKVTILWIVDPSSSEEYRRRTERDIRTFARDAAEGQFEIVVEEAEHAHEAILRHTDDTDLVVMGMHRSRGLDLSIGEVPLEVARASEVPLVVIGDRRARPVGMRGLRT